MKRRLLVRCAVIAVLSVGGVGVASAETISFQDEGPNSRPIGALCESHRDCDSGFCLTDHDQPLCTAHCIDQCPPGLECQLFELSDGDQVFVCLPSPPEPVEGPVPMTEFDRVVEESVAEKEQPVEPAPDLGSVPPGRVVHPDGFGGASGGSVDGGCSAGRGGHAPGVMTALMLLLWATCRRAGPKMAVGRGSRPARAG